VDFLAFHAPIDIVEKSSIGFVPQKFAIAPNAAIGRVAQDGRARPQQIGPCLWSASNPPTPNPPTPNPPAWARRLMHAALAASTREPFIISSILMART